MIIGYLISRVERFLIYNEARHMEDTEENEINYLKKMNLEICQNGTPPAL